MPAKNSAAAPLVVGRDYGVVEGDGHRKTSRCRMPQTFRSKTNHRSRRPQLGNAVRLSHVFFCLRRDVASDRAGGVEHMGAHSTGRLIPIPLSDGV